MKLFAIGPLIVAVFLLSTLAYSPAQGLQSAQTRGPSTGQEEIPEWMRANIREQSERQGDNTLLTLLMVGNLIMTGIGFLTVVFKGGKYVEKVDRSEVDIANLWKETAKLRAEIHDK